MVRRALALADEPQGLVKDGTYAELPRKWNLPAKASVS
jgi:hypothetical protein